MNAKNLLRTAGELAVTAAAIALGSPAARADVGALADELIAVIPAFNILLVLIAVALLGAGIALVACHRHIFRRNGPHDCFSAVEGVW